MSHGQYMMAALRNLRPFFLHKPNHDDPVIQIPATQASTFQILLLSTDKTNFRSNYITLIKSQASRFNQPPNPKPKMYTNVNEKGGSMIHQCVLQKGGSMIHQCTLQANNKFYAAVGANRSKYCVLQKGGSMIHQCELQKGGSMIHQCTLQRL